MSNMNFSNRRAIDLFCGCGGISVGLQKAGFEIVAGVDIEAAYLCSFQQNFPEAHALNLDLAATSPDDFMGKVGILPSELFLLAGGPPCQGFSKNVPRKSRTLDDPRNGLMSRFLDYCEAIQPQFVLLENVAEMKNGFEQTYSQEVLRRLKKAGYSVTHAVLNAADYGVPQRRRRAFFVANRVGVEFQFPSPTHGSPLQAETLFALPSHISVWDAIGDLPSVEHGQGTATCDYAAPPCNEFQRQMRGEAHLVINHAARKLQPQQFERLSSLQPGQGLKDLPSHLQTKGGYSGAYGRLTKEMIAPTITRWVFHPGSGRWGHPVDIRTLTIRETARIQSFPDSYQFVGSFTQQSGQLGNAVAPLLAQRLGEAITSQSGASDSESISTNCSHESFSLGAGKGNSIECASPA